MPRLDALCARRDGSPWIIPFVTGGFPDPEETAGLLGALAEGGADAIEVGIPFSDPLADGPVIQEASRTALGAGTTVGRVLESAAAFRKTSQVPLLAMGYLNPILAYGAERFFAAAREAGIDGLILPDVPLEEAGPYRRGAVEAGLAWVAMMAPTTPDHRLEELDGLSTHFNYCVSLTGVTGARRSLPEGVREYLDRVRGHVRKPFVVGFGVSTADHVRAVSPPAAGVVIGSALIRALSSESTPAARRRRAASFVRELRR